jgi:hypothetical protein
MHTNFQTDNLNISGQFPVGLWECNKGCEMWTRFNSLGAEYSNRLL